MDDELLKILACPICKKDIFLKDNWLICKNCKRRYPIKDGIPIMLIEESQIYEEKEEE
ncbi:MAG: Trm112 family protein [Candidatus Omnitrophica bacterium]|nr:Trm112 family protein [Candidatus Omnitrophota bacterium]